GQIFEQALHLAAPVGFGHAHRAGREDLELLLEVAQALLHAIETWTHERRVIADKLRRRSRRPHGHGDRNSPVSAQRSDRPRRRRYRRDESRRRRLASTDQYGQRYRDRHYACQNRPTAASGLTSTAPRGARRF